MHLLWSYISRIEECLLLLLYYVCNSVICCYCFITIIIIIVIVAIIIITEHIMYSCFCHEQSVRSSSLPETERWANVCESGTEPSEQNILCLQVSCKTLIVVPNASAAVHHFTDIALRQQNPSNRPVLGHGHTLKTCTLSQSLWCFNWGPCSNSINGHHSSSQYLCWLCTFRHTCI